MRWRHGASLAILLGVLCGAVSATDPVPTPVVPDVYIPGPPPVIPPAPPPTNTFTVPIGSFVPVYVGVDKHRLKLSDPSLFSKPLKLTKNSTHSGTLFTAKDPDVYTMENSGYVLTAVKPGTTTLVIDANGDMGPVQKLAVTLVVTGGSPTPDPKPKPDPSPTPTPGKRFILVVEETGSATADRGKLINDAAIAARVKEKGHVFSVVDQDVKDASGNPPKGLAAWLARAKGKPLPRLFVISDDGTVDFEGDCPADPKSVLETITKAGG